MTLLRLKAANFRNIDHLDFNPGEQFNLFYGANGSGKTSILEIIYYLGLGRSFRSHLANRIIQYEATSFSVFAHVFDGAIGQQSSIGIEKGRTTKTRIKIGNDTTPTAAELVKILPLQLINPDSYLLLTSGPKHRRQFLDWGVFHVEPGFFPVWQRYQKALKQRNCVLQQQASIQQVSAWNNELVINAALLTEMRTKYIEKLIPIFDSVMSKFINLPNFTANYLPGWEIKQNLDEILIKNYSRDISLGYTQFGPHKADLALKVNGIAVEDILSRGEQKLLVIALKLAQGAVMRQLTQKNCIYLLDDLAAELDSNRRRSVVNVLKDLHSQVFITAVDKEILAENLSELPVKMFHVEQGKIENIQSNTGM